MLSIPVLLMTILVVRHWFICWNPSYPPSLSLPTCPFPPFLAPNPTHFTRNPSHQVHPVRLYFVCVHRVDTATGVTGILRRGVLAGQIRVIGTY